MSDHLSDKELLDKVRLGDQESFRQVYDRYFIDLYGYTSALLQDRQLAEDLIQELFIHLWEKKSTIEIVHLKAYLTTALRRKIINVYRNNKYVDLDETIIATLPSPNGIDDKLRENDLEQEFKTTLNKLPKKCRNVFYLSRIKMYKNREIAEELDISIRTVEAHISNALRHFKVH
ncbi:RNA polymerase sigma factor [Zobellia galactanivorans]|uniref:RNA polymerase sigma factor n=1 Tax=Zobellia galactanivorans (strain DSM 12802 / CCUG 47099 / CIP 106680 / NCIMB 13871 / Dsij) TaxID=63186 RepID=UPI001C068663|nr:RNA polymerase sigma-70 factor [Zobellia galactanivorans]MBU3026339.1 RNA polymerase sigma-70 factor [Zobellia galactanivorans]